MSRVSEGQTELEKVKMFVDIENPSSAVCFGLGIILSEIVTNTF